MDARVAQVGAFGDIRSDLDSTKPFPDSMWPPAKKGATERNYLFLSGGGSGGAFSVGALKAWSAIGTRPQFDIVTGVSTGALIAPFAFLGSAYDDCLVDLYTSGRARALISPGESIATALLSQRPLRQMVERYVNANMLNEIAVQHRKGRRLLVQTVNLDTEKPVVWSLGAIAADGSPNALKLIQDILIASASVPGAFPPVPIEVHSGSKVFKELHSDGGAASQFLAIPQSMMLSAHHPTENRSVGKTNMYILINNDLMPEFSHISNNVLAVSERAYSMLIKSQTQNSLLALYLYARQTSIGFHVASIDRHFEYSALDPFNTVYMREVFDLGYIEMATGTLWNNSPQFAASSAIASTREARRQLAQ
jgi:hypothetical protein